MAWEAVVQDHHQIKGWRQGAQCVENSVQHLHVLYIWKSSSKVSWSRQFATKTSKQQNTKLFLPFSKHFEWNDILHIPVWPWMTLALNPFTLPMSVEPPGTYWLKYRCTKRSQKGLASSDKCLRLKVKNTSTKWWRCEDALGVVLYSLRLCCFAPPAQHEEESRRGWPSFHSVSRTCSSSRLIHSITCEASKADSLVRSSSACFVGAVATCTALDLYETFGVARWF